MISKISNFDMDVQKDTRFLYWVCFILHFIVQATHLHKKHLSQFSQIDFWRRKLTLKIKFWWFWTSTYSSHRKLNQKVFGWFNFLGQKSKFSWLDKSVWSSSTVNLGALFSVSVHTMRQKIIYRQSSTYAVFWDWQNSVSRKPCC